MEKNKFQRASKSTKKEIKTDFFQSDYGKSLKVRLTRLLIYSILLTLCAIYFFIDAFIGNFSISQIIVAIFCLIFAGLFIWGRCYVIVKSCNNYMINNPKNTKKKK